MTWTPINQNRVTNPYVHWWEDRVKPQFKDTPFDDLTQSIAPTLRTFSNDFSFDIDLFGELELPPPDPGTSTDRNTLLELAQDAVTRQYGSAIPLPPGAVNHDFSADEIPDWTARTNLAPKKLPPKDSVVIGIIDAAIALGHERFRRKNGETRFLSAWQQSAPFSRHQRYLPFGRELSKAEIDMFLRDASPGKHPKTHASLGTPLDEDAFNVMAGMVDMQNTLGQRELHHRVAHGTHVLDLATGYDPNSTDDDLLARRPIIAVNLPNRFAIGSSGTFLEYFVIQGITRIVDQADKFWSLRKDVTKDEKKRGYPIVINLSYGLNAGPKDGTTLLEAFLSSLIRDRRDSGKAPLRIVLPAGNDNLERGNAVWTLGREPKEFPWRILPEDQTSNYLEIWTDQLSQKDPAATPLEIKVTPPGGGTPTQFSSGADQNYQDIGDYARIYCQYRRATPVGEKTEHARQRFVICVAPTLAAEPDQPEAPAGLWSVEVRFADGYKTKDRDVFVHVQSDQSTRPGGETGLLSYLDHPNYRVYDETGQVIDAYSFDKEKKDSGEANRESNNRFGPVQRRGSLNAIASLKQAIVVAGHRVSDGRPAPYSSAGSDRLPLRRTSPTVSYPSDETPSHPGVMAAGSRSGSVVVMQGTSFATAQATRQIADMLAKRAARPAPAGDGKHLKDQAEARERRTRRRKGIQKWKTGAGRMAGAPSQRAPRTEPD